MTGPVLLTGCQSLTRAIRLSCTQVICVAEVPPTSWLLDGPHSAEGAWPHRVMHMECASSALAAAVGAAVMGARVLACIPGVARVHGMLGAVAQQRLPMVLVDPGPFPGPGRLSTQDLQQCLAQRDVGWVQILCTSPQDVLDHVVLSHALAERARLPVMLVMDSLAVSHGAAAVNVPSPESVAAFMERQEGWPSLQVDSPTTWSTLVQPPHLGLARHQLHRALENVVHLLPQLYQQWSRLTGRHYHVVESHGLADADVTLMTVGSVYATARETMEVLRDQGLRTGLAHLRMFTPFPSHLLRTLLRSVPRVAVVESDVSMGHGGILFQALASALYNVEPAQRPSVLGYVAGMGGVPTDGAVLERAIRMTLSGNAGDDGVWLGECAERVGVDACHNPEEIGGG